MKKERKYKRSEERKRKNLMHEKWRKKGKEIAKNEIWRNRENEKKYYECRNK